MDLQSGSTISKQVPYGQGPFTEILYRDVTTGTTPAAPTSVRGNTGLSNLETDPDVGWALSDDAADHDIDSGHSRWVATAVSTRAGTGAWTTSDWVVVPAGTAFAQRYSDNGDDWHSTETDADYFTSFRQADYSWGPAIQYRYFDRILDWLPITDWLRAYRTGGDSATVTHNVTANLSAYKEMMFRCRMLFEIDEPDNAYHWEERFLPPPDYGSDLPGNPWVTVTSGQLGPNYFVRARRFKGLTVEFSKGHSGNLTENDIVNNVAHTEVRLRANSSGSQNMTGVSFYLGSNTLVDNYFEIRILGR